MVCQAVITKMMQLHVCSSYVLVPTMQVTVLAHLKYARALSFDLL